MSLTITRDFDGQTVISTFEMTPGTCADVLEALIDAYETVIRHQPGFIGAALHVNDAQTRIATYSRWQRREDFQAMLRSDEMRKRNRQIAAISRLRRRISSRRSIAWKSSRRCQRE